ncbi:hypothetical protein KW486_21860 [Vibrio fluvialis]|nr:hypothetical protein [Vibrio fluvialis]ELV8594336.1 hypothetical protein [Vibrio fluvialis]MBY8045083.1 hypothetical protein [Vibrio fluvialis]MBY8053705.1 hypothetical protein [Vibrio fluvialis]
MLALFARIGSWLAGLVGFKVFELTNRYVFLGALIAMYLALYVGFMASVVAVFSFSPVQPGGNVAAGLALLPGNIGQCMSAVGAAHVICHVVLIKSKIIRMSASGA